MHVDECGCGHKRVEVGRIDGGKAALEKHSVETDDDGQLDKYGDDAGNWVDLAFFVEGEHLLNLLLLVIFVYFFYFFKLGGYFFEYKLCACRFPGHGKKQYLDENSEYDYGEADVPVRDNRE